MASSGNFCTWDSVNKSDDMQLKFGNTMVDSDSAEWNAAFGTMGMKTGKWYWEVYEVGRTYNGYFGGIYRTEDGKMQLIWDNADSRLGGNVSTYGTSYAGYTKLNSSYASKFYNGTETALSLSPGSNGDIWQWAFDADAGKVWIGKNNTWSDSGDPANGNNPAYSSIPAGTYVAAVLIYGSTSDTFHNNWGQDDTFGGRISAAGNQDENGHGVFKYAPPTGFLALCSANLPISDDIDPAGDNGTDDNPTKQFNPILYTGNGGTNAITGLGFKPDLVWLKRRDSSASHQLYDSSRGTGKLLSSNTTDAEQTVSTGVNSFDTDGFTLGSAGGANASGGTFVAWCWRANGGTTATNSEGDANSTVQANTAAGFSIVQFPNYSGDTKFGHGLTKAPNFIIAKLTASGSNYPTYHDGYSSGKCCFVNLLNAEANSTHFALSGTGNPVSATTFGLGASFAGSGAGVAYCWHDVEGYSKFGKYEGNGDDENGPFIYTGFRPRVLFVKNIDTSNEWFVQDTARETHNVTKNFMEWNSSDAEQSNDHSEMDILSNGFKCRGNSGRFNDTATYVYGAWGDVPTKYGNTF